MSTASAGSPGQAAIDNAPTILELAITFNPVGAALVFGYQALTGTDPATGAHVDPNLGLLGVAAVFLPPVIATGLGKALSAVTRGLGNAIERVGGIGGRGLEEAFAGAGAGATGLRGLEAEVGAVARLGNETGAAERAAKSVRTPEELVSIASRIKNAPDVHPAQLSHQVIAVGTDADGTLVAASNTSSSFTRGQRAIMDELGVLRAPSRTVAGEMLHAEENLLGVMPNPTGIGTSALSPCPGICSPLLSRFGIPWATAP